MRRPIDERRRTGWREPLLTEAESDVLFDAAERAAQSQARGPVGRSEWWPAESRFVDLDPLDPSEAEEQADRAREEARS